MKLRPEGQDPFQPPDQFGRSLHGFTLNILVRNLAQAVQFHRDVLGTEIVYDDLDIAIVQLGAIRWMIHADHTYDKHALHAYIGETTRRGVGAEFRLHGIDPDAAEQRARDHGYTILSTTRNQPDHGLREVHILDAEGYVWVADVPLPT